MKKEATVLLIVLLICGLSGVTVTATESTTAEARLEPPTANLTEPPEGKVPSVEATEVEQAVPVFREADDGHPLRPNHPPIDQIPPMPMPEPPEEEGVPTSTEPGAGVYHNSVTGETVVVPVEPGPASEGVQQGGGYNGADGGYGSELIPMTFRDMYQITNTGDFPWRMNTKLVMRFGSDWYVCSGTMRDAETVLTAGHCVYDYGGYGWADEIWVYPGWDGAVTGDNAECYGWGHSTTEMGVGTGWFNSGDLDADVGLLGATRAVGMLTGWFSWSYGGSCDWHKAKTYNNPSYPAECCNPPACTLHNGLDMYYWYGNFNSCPWFSNQLQVDTTGGCFNAGWGGMSGSGAYYIDSDNRYVHAVASTSDRSTWTRYCRQWEDWVDWSNDYFIPNVRGSAFDLQALDVNAEPETIEQGGSTTLLNHLATNPTDGSADGTWTFGVYLSTNDNISPSDTLLSTQHYGWNFNSMSSVRVNMGQVTIPYNTPPGDYWIGVVYDSATDGNSANNDADGWDAVPIHVIDTTPPPAPVISSSTHPEETKWYCNRNPTFTWTTPSDPSGIACYSYSLDHSPTTTPDTTCDTTGNSKSYTNLDYDTWHFHVRAKDNADNWGPTDHYRVKIENCDDKDGCYAYGTGCENRDYYCSGGSCTYTYSNRHTDYYDDWVYYCSGDTVRKHRLFHDFYCEAGTCTDHTSWGDDQLVENCNAKDGWYCNGNIREYRDYYCSDGSCAYTVTSSENCNDYDGCYAYGDGCENRDYYCSGGSCAYTYSNRHTDYYDSYVYYCKGDEVWKHRLFHDFYCDGGTCSDHTSWMDDQLVENCNAKDGWYCNGDVREYRDYYCSGGSCTYTVTSSENCNNYDGCYAYGDGCEDRDYYCSGGSCAYTYSNRQTDYYDDWGYYCKGDEVWKYRQFHDFYCDGGSCTDHTSWMDDQLVEDCNDNDGWVDTGNTRWVNDPGNECKEKEQKEQKYRDYTCSGGSCDYSVTDTQWVDTGNERNKSDGTICGCTVSNTLKECYDGTCTDTGICNSTICSADVTCDGKELGGSCGTDRKCNSTCNCVLAPNMGITITAPENKTYASKCIRLNFTVEPEGTALDWIGYSLDGGANVTIAGNTTIGGLGAGGHNIVVYVNDTAGKENSSDTVSFTLHQAILTTIATFTCQT